MKLFICKKCHDLVSLQMTKMRYCLCGKSFGRYLKDNVSAEMGGNAVPFGISNDVIYWYIHDVDMAERYDNFANYSLQKDKDDVPIKYLMPIMWKKNYEKKKRKGGITRIKKNNAHTL